MLSAVRSARTPRLRVKLYPISVGTDVLDGPKTNDLHSLYDGWIWNPPEKNRPARKMRLRMNVQCVPILVCYIPTDGRFMNRPYKWSVGVPSPVRLARTPRLRATVCNPNLFTLTSYLFSSSPCGYCKATALISLPLRGRGTAYSGG